MLICYTCRKRVKVSVWGSVAQFGKARGKARYSELCQNLLRQFICDPEIVGSNPTAPIKQEKQKMGFERVRRSNGTVRRCRTRA